MTDAEFEEFLLEDDPELGRRVRASRMRHVESLVEMGASRDKVVGIMFADVLQGVNPFLQRRPIQGLLDFFV